MKTKNLLATLLLAWIVASPLQAQTSLENPETTNAVTQVTNDPTPQTNPKIETNTSYFPHDSKRSEANHDPAQTDLLELVAVVMALGMPVAIVGMFFYFRFRKAKMLHETLRAMIEKGVPIPPELLATGGQVPSNSAQPPLLPSKPTRQREDFRNGCILIAAGGGVIALAGKVGYIILFIGIAMVIVSFFDRRDKGNGLPPQI